MAERSDTFYVLLVLAGLALLVALVVAVVYFVRLARLWALVRNPAMPAAGKFAFWAGLIYAVSPIDVLPDPVYLDDVGVLAAAAALVLRSAKKAGLLDRSRLRPPGRADRSAVDHGPVDHGPGDHGPGDRGPVDRGPGARRDVEGEWYERPPLDRRERS